MTNRTSVVAGAGILALAFGFSGSARAQSASAELVDRSEAAHVVAGLERQVLELLDKPARSAEAAALTVQAARLRELSDPQRVVELRAGAGLWFYAGHPGKARALIEDVAVELLGSGDVVGAANADIDAAWLALREGKRDRAARLLAAAERLAASPLLGEPDRDAVLRRMRSPATTVRAPR